MISSRSITFLAALAFAAQGSRNPLGSSEVHLHDVSVKESETPMEHVTSMIATDSSTVSGIGADSMASLGFLRGDNPCTVTEDLTPAEWAARLLSEFESGQNTTQKTVVIRTGTMGSGKSSAVNLFLREKWNFNIEMFQIVDLDRMITRSQAYRNAVCDGDTVKNLNGKQMGDAWWAGQVATQGYQTVDNIITSASDRGLTFSIEQTGKFMCPLKKVVRRLFKKGYKVILASPYVPFFVLKGRVRARAEKEGRDVPTDELEKNMLMMLPKLFEMIEEADEGYVLSSDVKFGDPPELLMSQYTDWNKYDNQLCNTRTIDGQKVGTLLAKLQANEHQYTTNGEKKIFEVEQQFLQTMIDSANNGDPCVWS
jgi:predicted ABC-type ATPase